MARNEDPTLEGRKRQGPGNFSAWLINLSGSISSLYPKTAWGSPPGLGEACELHSSQTAEFPGSLWEKVPVAERLLPRSSPYPKSKKTRQGIGQG